MKKSWNWECKFSRRLQTVTDNFGVYESLVAVGDSKYGRVAIKTFIVRCSNPQCLELEIISNLYKVLDGPNYLKVTDDVVKEIGSVPSSSYVIYPEYIPAPLREDYQEACSIEQLSPKASATLSRRCIQGMIRDFCKISKVRLIDEIRELKRQVDAGQAPQGVVSDVMDAIDAVREIGNIGAHMERDINTIVDIDSGEARTLIELIELLFREWYIARHERQERITKIGGIKTAKAAQKLLPPQSPTPPTPSP